MVEDSNIFNHTLFRENLYTSMKDAPWNGRHVNKARLNGIAQGFAPELEKPGYRAWLDGIRKASVQGMEIPNEADDADKDRS